MEYFKLNFLGLTRNLPLVAITPKIRVASVNFLGDAELSEAVSREVVKKLKSIDFDIMVRFIVLLLKWICFVTTTLERVGTKAGERRGRS